MDPSQINYFKARYAAMSEDEIVFILAVKLNQLTDEARFALNAVVKDRNIANIQAEVQATAEDVHAQLLHEQAVAREKARSRANVRWMTFTLCAVLCCWGIWLALFRDPSRGLAVIASGVFLALVFELRRLVLKLVSAMFRMD